MWLPYRRLYLWRPSSLWPNAKHVWLPYRTLYLWRPSTLWPNLKHVWYDLTRGVANLARWYKVIWFDREFDWIYLATLLEYKFGRMAAHHETHQVVTSWAALARQLRICELLCKRLIESDYEVNAKVFGTPKAIHQEAEAVQKQDVEYLGRLIGKHMRTWWD